jgi:hypothetical protein
MAVLLAGVLVAGAGCETSTGTEAGGTTLRDGVEKTDNPPYKVRTFGPGNRGR